jgi:hypothetical protein
VAGSDCSNHSSYTVSGTGSRVTKPPKNGAASIDGVDDAPVRRRLPGQGAPPVELSRQVVGLRLQAQVVVAGMGPLDGGGIAGVVEVELLPALHPLRRVATDTMDVVGGDARLLMCGAQRVALGMLATVQQGIRPTLALDESLQIPLRQRRQQAEERQEVALAGTVGADQHVQVAQREPIDLGEGLAALDADGVDPHGRVLAVTTVGPSGGRVMWAG